MCKSTNLRLMEPLTYFCVTFFTRKIVQANMMADPIEQSTQQIPTYLKAVVTNKEYLLPSIGLK